MQRRVHYLDSVPGLLAQATAAAVSEAAFGCTRLCGLGITRIPRSSIPYFFGDTGYLKYDSRVNYKRVLKCRAYGLSGTMPRLKRAISRNSAKNVTHHISCKIKLLSYIKSIYIYIYTYFSYLNYNVQVEAADAVL